MTKRLFTITALLVGIQFATLWIQHGYTMSEIRPPKRALVDLPRQAGVWKGEDTPADPQLTDYLEALQQVDRKYRDPAGNDVYVHAVWTADYVRVHLPQQCYREAGWTQTATEDLSFPVADSTLSARLLTFDRGPEQIRVLYWFQMGDRFFFDRLQQRSIRHELCWGQKRWPPLIKVMLQTAAPDPNEATANLQQIAAFVFAWISGGGNVAAPAAAYQPAPRELSIMAAVCLRREGQVPPWLQWKRLFRDPTTLVDRRGDTNAGS